MLKANKILILIFLIAIFIRLTYIFFFPQLPLSGDAPMYDRLGWDLATGKGFPVKSDFLVEPLRSPGYPLILAFIYKIFGHDLVAVRIFQALVGSLLCIFIYFLAMEVFNNNKIALLASAISAFYFPLVSYTGLISREAILGVVLVITVIFLIKAFKTGFLSYYILSGIFIGGLALFDERMSYFSIFIFLILLGVGFFKKKVLIHSLVLLACAFITISPWSIRNYIVFNKFIPVTRAQKACFWLSTHPSELLEWRFQKEPLKSLVSGLSGEERFKKLSTEAIKNLKGHPLTYIKLSLKRFFRLWVGSHSNSFYGLEESFMGSFKEGNFGVFFVKFLMLLLNSIFIFSAVVGFYFAYRFDMFYLNILMIAPVIYLTIIHTLSFATPRYQIPMIPFLTILSSVAWIQFYHKVRGSQL